MHTEEREIYNPTVEDCIAAGAVSIADIPDEELIRYVIRMPAQAIIPVRMRYEKPPGHKCFHVEDLTSVIGGASDHSRYVILSVIRKGGFGSYPHMAGHFGLDEKSIIKVVAEFQSDPKLRDTMFLFPTLDSYLLFDSKFEVSTYTAWNVLSQPVSSNGPMIPAFSFLTKSHVYIVIKEAENLEEYTINRHGDTSEKAAIIKKAEDGTYYWMDCIVNEFSEGFYKSVDDAFISYRTWCGGV